MTRLSNIIRLGPGPATAQAWDALGILSTAVMVLQVRPNGDRVAAARRVLAAAEAAAEAYQRALDEHAENVKAYEAYLRRGKRVVTREGQ